MRVVVCPDPDVLARHAAAEITTCLESTVDSPTLGLAGGSTPRHTYAELAQAPFDWSRVDLWLSDERWVPPDDVRSNGAMISEIFASPTSARLHRPPYGENLHPDVAAAAYEEDLRSLFGAGRPEVVLLGMGADGHTASLFPGSAALTERRRWYVANRIPESGEWRLTSTYPLLLSARRLFVLVTGVEKVTTLAAVLEHDGVYPIQGLFEAADRLTWIVDEAAASRLVSTPLVYRG